MFTGIVTDVGEILSIRQEGDLNARIGTSYDIDGIDIGASIACDGVCLTVVEKTETCFVVEAWEEALRLTSADQWSLGTRLNLERALKVGDELGGHIVSGHVDGRAEIIAVKEEGEATRYTLRAPQELARFIAPKGSVAFELPRRPSTPFFFPTRV